MRKAISEARKRYEAFEKNRSSCMELAGRVRAESKAAINFFVKGETTKGKSILSRVPAMLKQLNRHLRKDSYLHSVASLNEGLEEYVEAVLLLSYIEEKKNFPSLKLLNVNHEAYICGLCDMTGELVRLARNQPERAKKIHGDVALLYGQCIQMYVKRNNRIRSKLQDLERNLRRLEEIVYEQRKR